MSEKTEEATPQKKRKAREDGDVAKSAEFTGVALMFAAFGTIVVTMGTISTRLMGFMRQAIKMSSGRPIDLPVIERFLFEGLITLAHCIGPLLAVSFVASAFFTYVQIGALFTVKPLIPDAKKLNAAANLKNLVNKDKLVELIKNLAKLSIMSIVGYLVLSDHVMILITTPRGELSHGLVGLTNGAFDLTTKMLGALIVFGVADLLWQRHSHAKKLRMSKDEVKREHKESEGDPHVKGQRKQMHQELINDAGVRNVPDADAVVVNPTHVAVALRYRAEEMRAPTVLATGRGELAKEIKKLAKRCNVPIVRNVALARALVDVGTDSEIPEEFYEPVAVILQQVYELKDK